MICLAKEGRRDVSEGPSTRQRNCIEFHQQWKQLNVLFVCLFVFEGSLGSKLQEDRHHIFYLPQ